MQLARRAVQLDEKEANYWNTLGVALYRDGQYSEAVEALDHSLQSGDDAAAGFDLIFLALCHSRLGNTTVANDYYIRAEAWLQQHQSRLSPLWQEELNTFIAEAKAVGSPPRQGGVVPLDHEPIRVQWTGRGIEPRSPGCRPGIFPLDEPPMFCQRSVRESNPAFRLTKAVCSRSTYRPQVSNRSDPGGTRTITFLDVGQVSSPLDHGIKLSVTEVGVEPTKSRGSRPRRFASLRTRPISSGSGGRTRRAELMRLGWALAHPRQ